MPLITAAQRLARDTGSSVCILGEAGVGKTTLARGLDPASTVFVDVEAGTKALADWPGLVIDQVRTWEYARALACLVGGPDPSKESGEPYSPAFYHQAVQALPDEARAIESARTIFFDSITALSRLCWGWAQRHPKAMTAKKQFDKWAAFGILAEEMITALCHMQHRRDKSVVMVGVLEKRKDSLDRPWAMQVEGQKTEAELPGIFDNIVTLTTLQAQDGTYFRAFVCHKINPWGFPAKDRTGTLSMVEPPDLRALLAKMSAAQRVDSMYYGAIPTPPALAPYGQQPAAPGAV